MVTYDKRAMITGYTQTGGDSEVLEFVRLITPNSIETGGDSNVQISLAASANAERCKWLTSLWHPNTDSWTNGTYTWRWRVTTLNTNLQIVEVILRRVSANCQTVVASKSSGALTTSLGTTGVKSGTISWSDGTQNPGGRSVDDRFEVVFRIRNLAASIQTGNVGYEHSTAANDDIDCPFSETAETATSPTGFVKKVAWQKPASGTTGSQTISVSGAGRIKAIVAVTTGGDNLTGSPIDTIGARIAIGFADGNRNNKAQAIQSADNVATTSEFHRRYNAICLSNDSTGLQFHVDITDLEVDQFKVDIVTNSLATNFYVIFYVFCGSDIEYSYVGQHIIPDATTGNKAATYMLPFQSTFNFFLPILSTSIDSGSSGGRQGFGWAKDSSNEGAFMLSTQNGATGANTASHLRADRCFIMPTNSAAMDGDAEFVSHDAAGFTYNVTNALGISNIVGYMGLKGGSWDCGTFNASAGTGNQTVNVNVSNFTPRGLLLASIGAATNASDTPTNGIRFGIGISDNAATDHGTTIAHPDAANPTTVASYAHNNILRLFTANATAASSTQEFVADISSLNSGNFVINRATNTDNLGTFQVLWLSLGTVQQVQNITRTITEPTITLSESTARLAAKTRARTEGATSLTESTARLSAKTRTRTEGATALTESIARLSAKSRPLATETVTLTESQSRLTQKTRTQSDTLTIGESIAREVSTGAQNIVRTITEAIAVQDTADWIRLELIRIYDQVTIVVAKNIAKAITEPTVTLSESSAKLKGAVKAASDTITLTESIARLANKMRAIAEPAVTLSESVARPKASIKTASDSIALSDNVARTIQGGAQEIVRSISETINASESIARMKASLRSLPETITATESIAPVKGIQKALSDSTTLTESATRIKNVIRSLSEALGVSESAARLKSSLRALSEAATISETVSRLKAAQRTVSETTSLTESLARLKSAMRSVSEPAVTISEQTTKIASKIKSVSEAAVTIADAVVREVGEVGQQITRTLTETIQLQDTLDWIKPELIRIFDQVTIQVQHQIAKTISEAISISDTIARAAAKQRTLSEDLSVSEVASRTAQKTRAITEPITTIAESVAREVAAGGQQITRTLADTITLAETLARQAAKTRAITQTISIAESLARQTAKARSISEAGIAIAESATRAVGYQIAKTISESITIGADTLTTQMAKIRQIAETISITQLLEQLVTYLYPPPTGGGTIPLRRTEKQEGPFWRTRLERHKNRYRTMRKTLRDMREKQRESTRKERQRPYKYE